MSDGITEISPDDLTLGWLMQPLDGTDQSGELASAVIVALGTDRRADEADELPALDSDDRRGWWGDTDAVEIWDGWPIGCRVWLLARSAIRSAGARQGSTLALAETYAYEALQPLIARGIASRVVVAAERVGTERIDAVVTIYRGPRDAVALRFQNLWTGIAA